MFKDRLDTLFGLLILGSALLAGVVFWLSMDPPVTRVVMDAQGEVIEIKTSSSYKIAFGGLGTNRLSFRNGMKRGRRLNEVDIGR
jgi:hypothetical protein